MGATLSGSGSRASTEPVPVSAVPASIPSACRNCCEAQWVCENHMDRPWYGISNAPESCDCGAGAPCPVCNPDMAFAGRRAAIIEECAAIALAPFDWGWGEAPVTYRALANRIGNRIRALQFASAIEARSDEMRSGSAVGESAAPKEDARA